MGMWKRLSQLLTETESRWSLWQLIQGTGLVASFVVPAWLTSLTTALDVYWPLSWLVAGAAGVSLTIIGYLLFQWARRIRVKTLYDAKFTEAHPLLNPNDKTFEKVRIYLNDFALPTHPFIDDKTFVDCQIVGPANIFLWTNSNITEFALGPKMDGVVLDPSTKFTNGFVFRSCVFRKCSFHRITLFTYPNVYEHLQTHESVNWISWVPRGQIPLPYNQESARLGEALALERPEQQGTEEETLQ